MMSKAVSDFRERSPTTIVVKIINWLDVKNIYYLIADDELRDVGVNFIFPLMYAGLILSNRSWNADRRIPPSFDDI